MRYIVALIKEIVQLGKIRSLVGLQRPAVEHQVVYRDGTRGRSIQSTIPVLYEIQHLQQTINNKIITVFDTQSKIIASKPQA